MSENTTIQPVEDIISGIWKFSDKITPETLVQLGLEFLAENPACYLNIHVRRCSKNQIGISFIYRLYAENRPDQKFDAFYAFFHRTTDRLKRRFGNDFVGWDIAEEVWAVQSETATEREGSWKYRAMIYFAAATFYFYRNDIVPLNDGELYGVFAEKNKAVVDRVFQEALNLFDYELSHEQMGCAIKAYCANPRPLATTEPATHQ